MIAVLRILCCFLALAASFGCATRQASVPAPTPVPMTPEAALNFDYLLYLDQRSQLMSMTMGDPQPGSEGFDQALAVQQTAVAALERVLAKKPSAMLYGEKAALYFNPRQIATAVSILRNGLKIYPTSRTLLGLMANAYLIKKDMEMAALTMEEFLINNPDAVEERIRLVSILLEAKEYARALDQIKKIPKEHHNDRVLYFQARAQSRIGNRAKAKKTIARILKSNPDHYEALAELAYIHELDAELGQAVKAYFRLLELGGPEAEIRSRLIVLELKLNRVDNALKTALEGPNTKKFLLQAASQFLNQEFPAQASAVLDRLSGQVPAPPEYYFYKAVIAFEAEEDPDKALDFLHQITPDQPNHNQALLFQVQILMDLGRKDQGMKLLTEARKAFPDDLRFDRVMAEYLTLEDKLAEATDILHLALQKYGDNAELLFQYGALLDHQGKRAEAIAIMERIIKSNPQNAEALNYVGYTLAEEGRDLDRALVLIKNALAQKPQNGAIIDSLAWIHFKRGDLSLAWAHIQQAVEFMNNDAVIWEHYGDIAAADGKKKAAKNGYTNALKFKAKDPKAVQAKIDTL